MLLLQERTMTIKRVLFASLLILVMQFTTPAHAQFSSSLQGTVTDTTGAVVPGVTITATNTDTGVSTTSTSGPQGDYRVVSLAPGPYEVTATAKGFAIHKISLTLLTNESMNLPFNLTISNATTTVEVNDTVPLLDTADSRTQLTITREALSALPMAGRNVLSLTSL